MGKARAKAVDQPTRFVAGPCPRPWTRAQLTYFAWLESRRRPACIFCRHTRATAPIESGLLHCITGGFVWPGEERACFKPKGEHQMAEEQHLTAVFSLFADLCTARGHRDLNKHPGLFWVDVGAFRFGLNAHAAENEGTPAWAVKIMSQDGFPLGFAGPFGGALMFGAEPAIIAALEAAVAGEALL